MEPQPKPNCAYKFALALQEANAAELVKKRAKKGKIILGGLIIAFMRSSSKPKGLKATRRAAKQKKATPEQQGKLDRGQFEDGGIMWEVPEVECDELVG